MARGWKCGRGDGSVDGQENTGMLASGNDMRMEGKSCDDLMRLAW